jgi:hypothetical protein
LIAIVLSSIAFFAKAKQPKSKPQIQTPNHHKQPIADSPANNAKQSGADQRNAMAEQATNTGKKWLGKNKAIANAGICIA